jgi:hypothetical protein
MSYRTLTGPVVAIAVVVAAGLGYFGYVTTQKHSQQQRVKAVVADTTEKLRQVLASKSTADLAGPLDANLKQAKAPRDPKFADAAELYIISAREIARRRAEIDRLTRQAAASRQALAAHMANAAHRGTGWLNQAVALKKRVEDDHFNLGVELKALDELLFTLPDAEQTLEPYVGRDALVDVSLSAAARKETQAELRRSTDELERARHLR